MLFFICGRQSGDEDAKQHDGGINRSDRRIDGLDGKKNAANRKREVIVNMEGPPVPQLGKSRLKPFHFLLLIPLHFSVSEHKHH